MDTNTLMIDMFSMIVASPSINLFLQTNVAPKCVAFETEDVLVTTVNWISFVQIIFFALGLFAPRGSTYSSRRRLEMMPTLCYWSIMTSMVILPVINIVISIFHVKHYSIEANLMMLNLLIQVATIGWFRSDFLNAFNETYDADVKNCKTILAIKARANAG